MPSLPSRGKSASPSSQALWGCWRKRIALINTAFFLHPLPVGAYVPWTLVHVGHVPMVRHVKEKKRGNILRLMQTCWEAPLNRHAFFMPYPSHPPSPCSLLPSGVCLSPRAAQPDQKPVVRKVQGGDGERNARRLHLQVARVTDPPAGGRSDDAAGCTTGVGQLQAAGGRLPQGQGVEALCSGTGEWM